MDVAALVISIVALLVSAVVACVEYYRDFKITSINLEFEFYKNIYMEHLVKKIPEARSVIWIDETHRVRDTQKLLDELNEIRRDSLFFLYNNKKFYQELKAQLQGLEDFIVLTEDKELLGEDKETFLTRLQIDLDAIYEIISKAYNGKYSYI